MEIYASAHTLEIVPGAQKSYLNTLWQVERQIKILLFSLFSIVDSNHINTYYRDMYTLIMYIYLYYVYSTGILTTRTCPGQRVTSRT